ncbi:MAG: citramalate synthase [bacterium]|nr:citramalate synthase [bacterium]
MNVEVYDTTLRDGTQAEGISFSVADKIRVALELDKMGYHFIEGGWPGSNPKDIDFFKEIKSYKLKNARIAAFGSTRRMNSKPEDDPNLIKIIEAETPVVTMFGKSWKLHVLDILRTTLQENLDMIYDSVKFTKKCGRFTIYDAEHFFDGYKDDNQYALETLLAAERGGADRIVLCDTNGGTLPREITQIIGEVKKVVSVPLGIHAHNDGGLGVANSLAAIEQGAIQVQGTTNGFGERCGNANLTTIVPNLMLKYGYKVISEEQLKGLCELSQFVDELANRRHDNTAPFVGISAFAHKGGIHVNAVQKDSVSYEHIVPELVGNSQRILVSELSGRSNIALKAKELNIDLHEKTPETQSILVKIKELEHQGYEFEAAEGSFELLVRKTLQHHKDFFTLESFRVIVERRDDKLISEATLKLNVQGEQRYTVAEGHGPVDAMDLALRKALRTFYPKIDEIELVDFKVRVLEGKTGTAAKVRVLIESKSGGAIWGTVGVSQNIVEACWEALADSYEYKLLKDESKTPRKK